GSWPRSTEFFVMRQARTRGVGGRLLAAAETALAARGCVRLQLQLGVGNAGGRAFYEHRGPPGQGTSSSTSPSQPVDERTSRRPDSSHRLRRTTLSALRLSKVYHDLYWVATEGPWPKIDPAVALNELARVVKPGGVLLLLDHSAKPGTGSAEAGRLHRIDEEYARSDFEKHGFRFVSKSDAVRRPDDPRDQITYKGPMVGKTDRFVMVFRKSR